MKARLSQHDFVRAARTLDVEVAAIRAVLAVETNGEGFLLDGRPKILFERHWFRRLTNNRFNASHPDLSSITPGGYSRGPTAEDRMRREWDRLTGAISLDESAAIQSASWGLPQILGVNYRAAGCRTVQAFRERMSESEGAQLDLMVNFLISKGLQRFLVARDWAGFARRYNGPAFAKNRYDEKLATSYRYFISKGDQNDE